MTIDDIPNEGFPSHTKFFLLRHFTNEYLAGLKDGGQMGSLVHTNREGNALTLEVLQVIDESIECKNE